MIDSMKDLPILARYLSRIGAEPRSLRTAVVREISGDYWKDVATIRIKKDGTITASDGYEPLASEVDAIKAEVIAADWPTSKKIGKGFTLPPELETVDPRNLFYIRNRAGELLMIHQRLSDEERSDKGRYAPWTLWTDNKWRKAEPDEDKLPIWGMELIGHNSVLFIHEGAKAARFCHELVNPKTDAERIRLGAHPWGIELSNAAHVGWIGGALNPKRTDWSEINRMGFDRIYIVGDNDSSGKEAIPKISAQLKGVPVYSIEFTDQWPACFDLADDFPEKMFSERTGTRIYNGPSFKALTHTATWATDKFQNGKGKPSYRLRKEFSDMWAWINDLKRFVCKEMTHLVLDAEQFNAKNRPFCDKGVSLAPMMQEVYGTGETTKLCYSPEEPKRLINDGDYTMINLFQSTPVKPTKGDARPWIEFLEYLFPVANERKEIERWCATLIAHPEVRMLYALLLVTETQGIGKTTLGSKILSPLVGRQNTSYPNEHEMIDGAFNSWLVKKRLVVIAEIYSGHSFKAYNTLKEYISDGMIRVKEKYMIPYEVRNWIHIIACSNSTRPLKIEDDERRWYYPEMTESKWPREKFAEFYNWIDGGGLSIIMQWAMDYGDYVKHGDTAPMTERKRMLAEESQSENIRNFKGRISIINGERVAISINQVIEYMKQKNGGRAFESSHDYVKAARPYGWQRYEQQIHLFDDLTAVIISPALRDEMLSAGIDYLDIHPKEKFEKKRKMIKAHVKKFEDIRTNEI